MVALGLAADGVEGGEKHSRETMVVESTQRVPRPRAWQEVENDMLTPVGLVPETSRQQRVKKDGTGFQTQRYSAFHLHTQI